MNNNPNGKNAIFPFMNDFLDKQSIGTYFDVVLIVKVIRYIDLKLKILTFK